MKIYINYDDERWRKYKIDFNKIANAAALHVGQDAEVSIVLTNDAKIHQLNKTYKLVVKGKKCYNMRKQKEGEICLSYQNLKQMKLMKIL